MALSDKRILESERNAVYVKATEGSRLTGTVTENKNVFDKFPQLIMTKFNELIDLLVAFGLDTIATDITDRYTKNQVDDLIETETGNLVADVGIDLTTGVITVTKKDGTTSTIDTALEKVPATFEFVQDAANDKYYIKVTNVDGTSSQTEVTNLMNQYTFTSGDKIQFAAEKNGTTTTITATVKAGSITMTELDAAVKNYFDELASAVSSDKAIVAADKQVVVDASQTVTENTTLVLEAKQTAVDNANLSKSYAVGGTNTRTGEDTDNAMYYADQAKTSQNAAAASANSAASNASAAEAAKSSASGSASSASASANSASSSASAAAGSASAAATSESNAASAASSASGSAASASESASSASASAANAGEAASAAAEAAEAAAQSAAEAAEAAGGDFVTTTTLNAHNTSDTAHADIRNLISEKPSASDITSAVSTHNTDPAAHADIRNILAKKGNTQTTRVTNVSIASSAWAEDTTFEDYPYKATLAINGVTADMECKTFLPDHTDPDLQYLFAPWVNTGTDTLEVWANSQPTEAITIELITFEEVL